MGIEEGTCWDEHWVLYGNQFNNKIYIKKKRVSFPWVFALVQASLVRGTGYLWNFGWGMGEGDGACQDLCSPAELSSVFWSSTALPPSVLLLSLLSESRAVDF